VSGVELRAADPSKLYDVGLVGTGPAAIALAAELGRAGAKVCVVGPVQGAWPNNYGVWRDEWEELGLPERCIEETYASTRITISVNESISIPRGYPTSPNTTLFPLCCACVPFSTNAERPPGPAGTVRSRAPRRARYFCSAARSTASRCPLHPPPTRPSLRACARSPSSLARSP